MIQREVFEWDNRTLVKTYSDTEGMAVRNIETGEIYGEAIDPIEMHREYEEVPEPEPEVNDNGDEPGAGE